MKLFIVSFIETLLENAEPSEKLSKKELKKREKAERKKARREAREERKKKEAEIEEAMRKEEERIKASLTLQTCLFIRETKWVQQNHYFQNFQEFLASFES